MMVLLSLYKVLLPLLYLMVFGIYIWLLRTNDPRPRRWCTQLAVATVFVHMAAQLTLVLALHRLPMAGPLEFLSALALGLMATYLVIEKRIMVKQTGFLVAGMAFILQFLSSSFSTTMPEASPLLKDPGFAGHAVLVLLSYTAFCLSFLFAILYLLQARQLLNRQFGLLFMRLPALDTLERMSVGAVELGTPLLLAALCLGHLWMYDLADRLPADLAAQLSPWDPKILISWVIFLGYSVGLVGHRFFNWQGRRMNILAVSAFVCMMVTMGLAQHFFPTFHKFHSNQSMADLIVPHSCEHCKIAAAKLEVRP
jgi:HemX protein